MTAILPNAEPSVQAELPKSGGDLVSRPIAYVLAGGSAHFNVRPAGNGMTNFAEWAIENGPKLKEQGYSRLFIHNPGGLHAKGWMPNPENAFDSKQLEAAAKIGVDTRLMWVDQWSLAQQSDCRFANDRELKLFHDLLTVQYGITEIMYYVGAPDSLKDPYTDGLAAVKPFTDLGKEASLAFDVLGYEPHPMTDYERERSIKLCEELTKRGHRVYLEPRPAESYQKQFLGKVAGTVAGAYVDKDRPAQLKIAGKLGDVIQLQDSDATEELSLNLPKEVTPLVRAWQTVKASAYEGRK